MAGAPAVPGAATMPASALAPQHHQLAPTSAATVSSTPTSASTAAGIVSSSAGATSSGAGAAPKTETTEEDAKDQLGKKSKTTRDKKTRDENVPKRKYVTKRMKMAMEEAANKAVILNESSPTVPETRGVPTATGFNTARLERNDKGGWTPVAAQPQTKPEPTSETKASSNSNIVPNNGLAALLGGTPQNDISNTIQKELKKLIENICPPGTVMEFSMLLAVSSCAVVFLQEVTQEAKEVRREWRHTGPLRPVHIREAVRRLRNLGTHFPFNHDGFKSLRKSCS